MSYLKLYRLLRLLFKTRLMLSALVIAEQVARAILKRKKHVNDK